MTFRAGDSVQVHSPDGTPWEKWLLAADERNGAVVCCGWPESVVRADRCTLIKAASDAERLEILGRVAKLNDLRGSWARQDLASSGKGEA